MPILACLSYSACKRCSPSLNQNAQWTYYLEHLSRIGSIPLNFQRIMLKFWRKRGLMNSAMNATPLGVAILHANLKGAEFLLG